MSSNREPSALRRKAGAGRPPPEIGQVTPARALRAALVQAAQDVAALVASPGDVETSRTTLAPIVDALPDHPLLALLEGPAGRFGLVVLDGQAVAALIEMQTTGRVTPRPAVARAATRTDAIMCADFIDRLLEVLEVRLAEAQLAEAPLFSGFRYAVALAEARSIPLTLDDVPYRRLAVTVDFGRGAKSGQVLLVLPHDPPGHGARADGAAFTAALQAQVLETEAHLAANLARRALPLDVVSRLAVGATIPLPRSVLDTVDLTDLDGRIVARGRLGQVDGRRAVRLTSTADPPDRDATPASCPGSSEPPRVAGPTAQAVGGGDTAVPTSPADGAPAPLDLDAAFAPGAGARGADPFPAGADLPPLGG